MTPTDGAEAAPRSISVTPGEARIHGEWHRETFPLLFMKDEAERMSRTGSARHRWSRAFFVRTAHEETPEVKWSMLRAVGRRDQRSEY